MGNTKIEWTESTWNPVTGCTKVSSGCRNCYAERMAKRLQAMGQPNYQNGFQVTYHEATLGLPLKWKSPRMVFVNSMGDLFHEDVPETFIVSVFGIMEQAYWHRFQVLTKRENRLVDMAPRLGWSSNIWMGVTVEDKESKHRIKSLQKVPAAVRFLSIEPLLEPLGRLDLRRIQWVIVGGESGPGARPMQKTWVEEIKRQCELAKVAFFFKQWGGVNKKKAGRLLDGQLWEAVPMDSCQVSHHQPADLHAR